MSRLERPDVKIPNHKRNKDAVRIVFGAKTFSGFESLRTSGSKFTKDAVEALIYGELGDKCQRALEALDDYLEESKNIWDQTSVMTGNTRGSLVVEGVYPDSISIEFDKKYWETPKVLTIIRPVIVKRTWIAKREGVERTRTYFYPAGKYKRKITGKDYAPRIPLPEHGGGNIDMLIAVYEERKKVAFKNALKRKGL